MQLLTNEYVAQRSLQMWDAVNKIEDAEIKDIASDIAKQRLEEMREEASLMEDEDFWRTLCEIAEPNIEEYFEGNSEEFKAKFLKLKNML